MSPEERREHMREIGRRGGRPQVRVFERNRTCAKCSAAFTAHKPTSRYCSPECYWLAKGDQDRKPDAWWESAEVVERFWSRVDKGGECWLWIGRRNKEGYGRTGWRRRPTLTHRIAWMTVNGDIPDGLVVCHHCDNPPCCNPNHLFLGTPKDNVDDCVAKGRQKVPDQRGERNAHAKLTDQQVAEIRARYRSGEKQLALAKEYGVGRPYISMLVNHANRRAV